MQTAAAVDRDISDTEWRARFHAALNADPRFRFGLFGTVPEAPYRQPVLTDDRFETYPFTVAQIRQMSLVQGTNRDATFDYGLALLKTASALVYTVQLAGEHALAAATDSFMHFALLNRIVGRKCVKLENRFIERTGY